MAESIPPIYLATAVQAVIKAGAMQMAGIDHLRIEKKGAIDLVTQVDRDVERMFRSLIGERFPDHAILAEEFEAQGDRHHAAEYCWVFDPVDGTTNYAHGLPIFCSAASLRAPWPGRRAAILRSQPSRALHRRARRRGRGSTARRCACRPPLR